MTVDVLPSSLFCRDGGLGVSDGVLGGCFAKYVDARGGRLGGR